MASRIIVKPVTSKVLYKKDVVRVYPHRAPLRCKLPERRSCLTASK